MTRPPTATALVPRREQRAVALRRAALAVRRHVGYWAFGSPIFRLAGAVNLGVAVGYGTMAEPLLCACSLATGILWTVVAHAQGRERSKEVLAVCREIVSVLDEEIERRRRLGAWP